MNKFLPIIISFLFLFSYTIVADNNIEIGSKNHDNIIRNQIEELIVIPDTDPFFGILGSYSACYYDNINNETGLVPLIVQNKGDLNKNQDIFLKKSLNSSDEILVLGEDLKTNYDKTKILGNASEVSIKLSTHVF